MVNYNETLVTFQTELRRLLAERERLDEQIKKLMKVIEIVQTLFKESDEPVMQPPPIHPDDEAGFTDKVRNILNANPFRWVTAVDIRDVLIRDLPGSDPKVVLIHTHNTLKRLEKQSEVEESETSEGRKAYRLKTESYADALGGVSAINYKAAAEALARPRTDYRALADAITKVKQQRSGFPPPPEFKDEKK